MRIRIQHFTQMRIRVKLFFLMRIRVQLPKLMRIHADPDTQPYLRQKVLEDDVKAGPRRNYSGRDDLKALSSEMDPAEIRLIR